MKKVCMRASVFLLKNTTGVRNESTTEMVSLTGVVKGLKHLFKGCSHSQSNFVHSLFS